MDMLKAIIPDYYKTEPGAISPEVRAEGRFQVFDVISGFKLDFLKGNAVKYICRAGRKPGNSELQDLKKAIRTLQRRVQELEGVTPDHLPLCDSLTLEQKDALRIIEERKREGKTEGDVLPAKHPPCMQHSPRMPEDLIPNNGNEIEVSRSALSGLEKVKDLRTGEVRYVDNLELLEKKGEIKK